LRSAHPDGTDAAPSAFRLGYGTQIIPTHLK
jgi:hypothetical protein